MLSQLTFRYHPDPIGSGSVTSSPQECRCCGQTRGYIYTGPVYSENDLDEALCPWCIADGSAHQKFDASFVDVEAFPDDVQPSIVDEITLRTPGFSTWQGEHWPSCCGDATAFVTPAGIREIRQDYRELESQILNHIIYDLQISGGAALRMLESIRKDAGPTVYVFRCTHCQRLHFYMDRP